MPLVNEADLAVQILGHNTPYSIEKDAIREVFRSDFDTFNQAVLVRLAIIDEFYLTQMSLRYFGISDLKLALLGLGETSVEQRGKFTEFITNPIREHDVGRLFDRSFGMHKNGATAGGACSLISKYAFFLTEGHFPIYDGLVRKAYDDIRGRNLIQGLPALHQGFSIDYFGSIRYLNEASDVDDFDKLDMLLWLYGKVQAGNYSLVLSKSSYQELIGRLHDVGILTGNESSSNIDGRIRAYVSGHCDSDLLETVFSPELLIFIRFCYDLR